MKYAARLTLVAARLRARGFAVNLSPGWDTRGHGDMTLAEHVTIHHTATGGTSDYPSLGIVTNGRADLAGPLANFGVGRAGVIHFIAAGLAWHAGATWQPWQGNAHSFGIEAENNGTGEPWGPLLMDALIALVEELRREFSIPRDRVQGHKEICTPVGRKIDPANFNLDAFRRATDPPLLNTLDDEMSAAAEAQIAEILNILKGPDKSRVPGSTASLTLFDAVRNADAAAYVTQHALTDPRPSTVPGSTARLSPLDAAMNADAYGFQALQRLAGLEAAVSTLAAALAKDTDGLSAAEILETVRAAISTAVVKVDVAVTSKES